tara:strand:+ start:2012 stop:2248 length:237 start_codon:yes stop_codon:yes gene_type:complete
MEDDLKKRIIQFCNLQVELLYQEEKRLRQSMINLNIQKSYYRELVSELTTGEKKKELPAITEIETNVINFPKKNNEND